MLGFAIALPNLQILAQAKQRAAKLAEKLRRLGIDPDSMAD